MNYKFIFEDSLTFEEKALRIFEFQKIHNFVYNRFCVALGVNEPTSIEEIPLLPILAFKEKEITAIEENSNLKSEKSLLFQSSGTSGMQRSKHIVADTELYKSSILQGMKNFYDIDEFVIWAYTPGYISNPDSSLIWMLNVLIERDNSKLSRFLEIEKPLIQNEINAINNSGKRLMLFGAAFGLLDLLEISKIEMPVDTIVMETGGMKTFKREMTKHELHQTRHICNGQKASHELG
jgi:hypothetical protein